MKKNLLYVILFVAAGILMGILCDATGWSIYPVLIGYALGLVVECLIWTIE